MKVLILGAGGNLGNQLTQVFSTEHDVIAWDKTEIDITDKELVGKKVKDLKPGLIINAASYNAVDKCEDDTEYEIAKKVNIDGPKNLAEASLRTGAIFLHYSTDYVFEGKKKSGYKEDDEPKPINRYGKTKFHGEKRILELSGKGLKWHIIRTSKLFGPKGKSQYTKPSFFDIMLKLSKEKEYLDVINEEISCFTYTPDLAQATYSLINGNYGFGFYHIVNEGVVSWYQAACELFKIKNINIKVNPIKGDKLERAAIRPKYSVLLNTKLPKLRPYTEALREYLYDLGFKN